MCLEDASARLYVARRFPTKVKPPFDFATMDHNIVIADQSNKVIAELLKKRCNVDLGDALARLMRLP
jgi:hypothetical protein